MSSKTSRKVATRAKVEPIVTRTKSAQQRRQLKIKNKDKKTEKLTKQEIKSTKVKTDKCTKVALPEPIPIPDDVIEQVEYYPDKLKRDVAAKKIKLKPKHNFTVIASTNKRKLATPHKGLKSPPPVPVRSSPTKSPDVAPRCSSPEPSVQDMVRMMEESRSLSDEDFMEILTCPSPVWWEDPPHGGFCEDAIIMISPEPEEKQSVNKKRKVFIPVPNTLFIKKQVNKQIDSIYNKKDEKFVKKKLKLENVLGNIRNKNIKQITNAKHEITDETITKLSESEGEISDLSYNEEEILKNLENMDIPIENIVKSEIDNDCDVKKEIFQESSKNHSTLVDVKPKIKDEFDINEVSANNIVAVMNSQCDLNLRGNTTNSDVNSSVDTKCNADLGCAVSNANNSVSATSDASLLSKKANKVITVRKIRPEQSKNDDNEIKSIDNSKNMVIESVRGKLDDFFKICKSSKRVKKGDSPIPAISLTDVKDVTDNEEKEIIDDKTIVRGVENRLKSCECDSSKTGNGTTDSSCEKCEKAVILPCDSCNFLADNKEVYRKHILSCKDVARIPWNHNYVLNQT